MTLTRLSAKTSDVLEDADAVEIARRIRDKEISALEAVEAAIARTEKVEPQLNAVAIHSYEAARARAQKPLFGEFAGVPTFIKDNDDVADMPTRHGSSALEKAKTANEDSPFVKHLLAQGLVSIGKSNLPEFGLIPTTEKVNEDPTRNPYNLDHSPGGSSGGSSALVAADVVPFAHGNDGGGSIRIPAACCGLVGLKPSRGRHQDIATYNVLPINLVSQGIISRSVRDTAHYYYALERHFKPRSLPPIGLVEGAPKQRLRIGFFTDISTGHQVHPEVRQTTMRAAQACDGLGHRVEEIACPYDPVLFKDFLLYWGFLAFTIQNVGGLLSPGFRRDKLEPFTNGLSRMFLSNLLGAPLSVARLLAAQRTYDDFFKKYDIIISPAMGQPPAKIGEYNPGQPDFDEMLDRLMGYVPFTPAQNICGAPAISLPIGLSSEGLPIGVQFAGPVGGEKRLIEIAFELEEAMQFNSQS